MLHIEGYEPKISESFRIEYWYDRHTRDWVVEVYDNNDIQQALERCADKTWRDSAIADFCEEYNTTETIKL